MIEKTSESSIMPFLIWCQLPPPSVVFHARCQVPAYITSGFLGSMASDSMSLMSLWPSGEMRFQLSPPSMLRKTPSSAPTTNVFESEGAIASERIDLPFIPAIEFQVLPLLRERKSSPRSLLSALHAAT